MHPDLKRPDRAEIEALLQDPATAVLEYLTRFAQLAPDVDGVLAADRE
jgi:hypothetical protein